MWSFNEFCRCRQLAESTGPPSTRNERVARRKGLHSGQTPVETFAGNQATHRATRHGLFGQLDMQAQPKCRKDLHHSAKARVSLFRERLVEAFP